MQDIPVAGTYDVIFYVLAWVLASSAGLAVTAIDKHTRTLTDLLFIAYICGCIACAVVGVLVRYAGATAGSEPYYLGIAVAVGCLGKKVLHYLQIILNALFQSILKRFGIDAQERDDDDEPHSATGAG